MKGLDTNVLVRYLVWDDTQQAEAASAVMDQVTRSGEPLFLSPLVMCEVVWVLESAYGLDRAEVLDALEAVLRTAQFTFSQKDVLWLALGDARRGKADYADYVIGRLASAAGADTTFTFDRELEASPLFEVL